jgi:hypothetical protein
MQQSGPTLKEPSIRRAERAQHSAFPAEYREFLLWSNGGKPDPCYFVLHKKSGAVWNWVAAFAPITSKRDDPLNFLGQNEKVGRYAREGNPVPKGSVAIGYTGSGDTILLFVQGEWKNQVWLKAWDEGADRIAPPDPWIGMYRIASSFKRFLGALCSMDEAEKRVHEAH